MCTQSVQCCSVRPKPILVNPKTKQPGSNRWKVKALFLKTLTKRRPSPNPLLLTPNPKQDISQNISVNMNINI
jgi:hypothetical protein